MSKEELKAALIQKSKEVGEEHLMKLVDELIEIGELLVAETDNPFDDLALTGLKKFKPSLMEVLDKIDGEDDVQ